MSQKFEIFGYSLKEYVSSSKACSFVEEGCILDAKFSSLNLDLSLWNNYFKIELILRRLSGDGKLIINEQQHIIHSKQSQTCYVSLESSLLTLERPQESKGQVCLLGIIVYTSEKEDLLMNWREVIRRCGRHGNLRLVNNELYASAGGFLESKRIKELVTDPPNMFQRIDDSIKFVGSCKITKLELLSVGEKPITPELYVSRNSPSPAVKMPPIADSPIIRSRPYNPPPPAPAPVQYQTEDEIILYDSMATNDFQKYLHVQNKLVSAIKSNGKNYLLLRKGGIASFSVSDLDSESEYVVILIAKYLNGNGKISLNFALAENDLSHFKELTVGH